MTATLETIISRPSLNDVFFFESLIDFNYIPNFENLKEVYQTGDGFINTELETPTTWEEIESRKSDLRPDLIEMLKYKRPATPLINHIMWTPGVDGQPPFNPFSLTYTFWHHYETYDQLITDYNTNLKDRIFNCKPLILQTNNTGVERCFVDGIEIEFNGAFASILSK